MPRRTPAAVAACWCFHTAAVTAAALLWAPAAGQAATAAVPAPAKEVGGEVRVSRPIGQVALGEVSVEAAGHLEVTVVDTRADDPGWSVTVASSTGEISWSPHVLERSAAFTDSGGRRYAQQVSGGRALPGHGLGIARLGATIVGPESSTVSVTVV